MRIFPVTTFPASNFWQMVIDSIKEGKLFFWCHKRSLKSVTKGVETREKYWFHKKLSLTFLISSWQNNRVSTFYNFYWIKDDSTFHRLFQRRKRRQKCRILRDEFDVVSLSNKQVIPPLTTFFIILKIKILEKSGPQNFFSFFRCIPRNFFRKII